MERMLENLATFSNVDSFLGKSRLPSEEIHHDGECEASRMRIMT
jgi:hypothetical protein